MALRQSVTDLAGTVVSALRTRLELFSLEAAEQRSRFIRLLAMTFGALLCITLAVLVFTLLLALYFWPTEYRYWALGLLALGYGLIGLWLFWAVRNALVNDPVPFSATLDELRRDASLIDRLREPAQAGQRHDVTRKPGGDT